MAGRRGISADTALRLGQYFFADAERGARVFLGMQSRYEVRAALVDLRPVLEAIAPRPDAVEARAAVLKLADAVESPA